jgi:multicomponent Na+:H+ antiporter subunit G
MQAVLVSVFTLLGAVFFLIAALGVVRLPDLLTRMHAATKAGAFGGALLLVGCAFFFADGGVTFKAVLTLVFFYLTAPIAGHMLGRAGYRSGAGLATSTHRDDMAGRRGGENIPPMHPDTPPDSLP